MRAIFALLALALGGCPRGPGATTPGLPQRTLQGVCRSVPATLETWSVRPERPMEIWAVGRQRAFVSTDGGHRFRVLTLGGTPLLASRVVFLDANHALVVGPVDQATGGPSPLWVVTDASVVAAVVLKSGTAAGLPPGSARFTVDASLELAVTSLGVVFTSTPTSGGFVVLPGRGVYAATVVAGEGATYRLDGASVKISRDGGRTFAELAGPWIVAFHVAPGPGGVVVVDGTIEGAYTTEYRVFVSKDFGAHWVSSPVEGLAWSSGGEELLDARGGVWATTDATRKGAPLLHSPDLGQTWELISLAVDGAPHQPTTVEAVAEGRWRVRVDGLAETVTNRAARVCEVDATAEDRSVPVTLVPPTGLPGSYGVYARFPRATAFDQPAAAAPGNHGWTLGDLGVIPDLSVPFTNGFAQPAGYEKVDSMDVDATGKVAWLLLRSLHPATHPPAIVPVDLSTGQTSSLAPILWVPGVGQASQAPTRVWRIFRHADDRLWVDAEEGTFRADLRSSLIPGRAVLWGRPANGQPQRFVVPQLVGSSWWLESGEDGTSLTRCPGGASATCLPMPFVLPDGTTWLQGWPIVAVQGSWVYALDRREHRLVRHQLPGDPTVPWEPVVQGLLSPSWLWVDPAGVTEGVYVLDGDLYRYLPPSSGPADVLWRED